MAKVTIYTDGSCLGNPGPGGYGVILSYGDKQKQLSKGYRSTTNNRMELLATIVGLNSLTRKCDVDIYTDSQYVKNGITTWIHSWKKKHWKTSANKAVKNVDLWKELDTASGKHKVNWHWVKAHAGNELNEAVDALAREAAGSSELSIDTGFEES